MSFQNVIINLTGGDQLMIVLYFLSKIKMKKLLSLKVINSKTKKKRQDTGDMNR